MNKKPLSSTIFQFNFLNWTEQPEASLSNIQTERQRPVHGAPEPHARAHDLAQPYVDNQRPKVSSLKHTYPLRLHLDILLEISLDPRKYFDNGEDVFFSFLD